MRATNEVHVVFLEEARYDVRAEGEGDAAVVFGPACDVLVGVGPEEVAEEALKCIMRIINLMSGEEHIII